MENASADQVVYLAHGTSADISLIENYQAQISNERLVEGYPARIPMIHIVTIGAGMLRTGRHASNGYGREYHFRKAESE